MTCRKQSFARALVDFRLVHPTVPAVRFDIWRQLTLEPSCLVFTTIVPNVEGKAAAIAGHRREAGNVLGQRQPMTLNATF